MTIQEAAQFLRVSTKTLRRWETRGILLPTRTTGNQRRYTKEQLETFTHTPQLPKTFQFSRTQKFLITASSLATLASLAVILYVHRPTMNHELSTINHSPSGAVLASQTILDDLALAVNVPATFTKDITAPNVIYRLTAGTGVTVTGDAQTPTISVTDQTGSVRTFKTVKVGTTTFDAGSNTDTLTLAAGDNVSLSTSTSDKKVTISASSPSVGITDDGSIVRLTSATDLLSVGSATGAAKFSIEGGSYVGDVFTASQAGNLLLRLSNTGNLTIAGNLYSASSGTAGFWQRNSGIVSPVNITDDLSIGGISTSSAFLQISGTTGRIFGSLIPNTGSQYDIGASARRWATVYGDTGNFTNLSSTTTTISGTTAEDFLINSDYTGADAQDSTLTFERGAPTTNAQFKWNSTSKYLSSNTPFFVNPDTSIAAGGTAALIINQPFAQDILTASASGATILTLSNSGNLTISGNLIGSSSGTSGHFQRTSGAISPSNVTDDLLIGGTATSSAAIRLSGIENDLLLNGKVSLKTDSNLTDSNATFVYDTSSDLDGGAWTTGSSIQASSWYNETLSSSTRGNTRAFPKRTVLIATNSTLLIYDATDNSLWMKFTRGTGYSINGTSVTLTSVFALNGIIYVGTSTNGLLAIDFIADRVYQYDYNAGSGGKATFQGSIADRNSNKGYGSRASWGQIASDKITGVFARLIVGKLYVAVTTLGGTSVINVSDSRVIRYID